MQAVETTERRGASLQGGRTGRRTAPPRVGRRAARLVALLFAGVFLSGTISAAAHAHDGGQARAYSCAVCAHAGTTAEAPPLPVVVFAFSTSDLSEASYVPVSDGRQVVRTARARAPPL